MRGDGTCEAVLARRGGGAANAPRARFVVPIVAPLHVDGGVARAPPAFHDWQVLQPQAALRAIVLVDAGHVFAVTAVARTVHQPVDPVKCANLL